MIISGTGNTESIAQSNLAIKMDELEERSEKDIEWGEREFYGNCELGYKYIQNYTLSRGV